MSITLSQFRLEARQRADMVNSNFVTDSELTGYINNSISELHDMLVQAYGEDYYVKEVEFNTDGTDNYELSSIVTDDDFYKLRGVDSKLNGTEWYTLKPFNFNERNRSQNISTNYGLGNIRYRIVGQKLRFTPMPDTNLEMKLWYVPIAQVLTEDTDSYNDLNNFSEYVIVDAAIKMMQKEESDVTVLAAQKGALKRRIEEAANNRDAGAGDSISDVHNENNDYFFGISDL